MSSGQRRYVIGVDFGTDSARAVIVDAADGRELASAVALYRRWGEGRCCDPAQNQFRQHPMDYVEALEQTIREAIRKAPAGTADSVVGLSIDTTGSTPGPLDRRGLPLALLPAFAENPNAMFILWKDHAAVPEAEEINRLARTWGGLDYTRYSGGVYSSEWFWAKILHVLRADANVRDAAYSWAELCDWLPALLTGRTDPLLMPRSRCAAGHKAMWHPTFNGLPAETFLTQLDPLLRGLRERLYRETCTADTPAGTLTEEWADRLGLPPTIVVGAGAFDAHMGAVGAGIRPHILTKIMGTATCDMMVVPATEIGDRTIRGICGQVDGSIIPGMIGLEAGQSAFGDAYAWFNNLLLWPVKNLIPRSSLLPPESRVALIRELAERSLAELSNAAERIPADRSGPLALDWMNGRRTPDANQALTGAIVGLRLGSDAPVLFRAVVEATAFGARRIVERFRDEGVRIDGVIAVGGVARKSPFVMQVVADVLRTPISVAKSEQTCALGAAMFAAVVAGVHPTVDDAMRAMQGGFEMIYRPRAAEAEIYDALYERYCRLGEFVERENR